MCIVYHADRKNRRDGGRGLIGVWNFHRQYCTAISDYLQIPTQDYLVKLVRSTESRTQHGIISFLNGSTKGGNAKIIKKEHKEALRVLRMHGQFWRQHEEMPQFDAISSVNWLHTSHIRFETKSAICAAQEQVLATDVVCTIIWAVGQVQCVDGRWWCHVSGTVQPKSFSMAWWLN